MLSKCTLVMRIPTYQWTSADFDAKLETSLLQPGWVANLMKAREQPSSVLHPLSKMQLPL